MNFRDEGYLLDKEQKVISLGFSQLSKNDYNLLSSFLYKFENLNELSMTSRFVNDVSRLKDLINLKTLKLNYCSISDISPLENLRKLETFEMLQNSIENIEVIGNFINLKRFEASGNPIKDISVLKSLINLNSLVIRSNHFHDISVIQYLRKLTELDLSENTIEDYGFISNLIKLKRLVLHHSNISDISFIKNLTNVEELYLGENLLEDISPLKKLKKLKRLYLFKNRIRDIKPLKDHSNLVILNIADNKIEALPDWVLNLNLEIVLDDYKEKTISIKNNPLFSPPVEIIKQGMDAIETWYKGEKIFVNEVKVLLVGHGEAGKTSLVKSIMGEKVNPKEPPTHHIKISSHFIKRVSKEIKLNFWDFGGQEVMHSTHQFFLSQRSIYILVLDGRKDEDPEYWLKHIESFGGKSPVLVVLNKIDTNPGFDVDRRFLKEKYPFIHGFYKTVCLGRKKGIMDLKAGIAKAIDNVSLLSTPWPINWIPIKQRLEEMSENFISQLAYEKLCEENEVNESSSKEILAGYLNDLGVVVHFKDVRLNDLHILQPRWASRAAYKIINYKKISENQGILNVDWMADIMKKADENDYTYSRNTHPYILDLMQKFELCFPINQSQYLIPELMDIQQPELPILKGAILKFFFVYEDLLPKSIMPRFIVRMHEDIMDNLRWRTGVVLSVDIFNTIAVVIADVKERKISVSVSGPRRREHFAIIRKTFYNLKKDFENLEVTEWIPLPDESNHSIEYAELIGYEESGLNDIFVGKLKKTYKVKDLLNGIEPENLRRKEFIWDAFICHSSKDKGLIRVIIEDFESRGITYWLDEQQIDPGDNTIDKITEGLQKSKFIVPCISHNQIKSGWSRNEYQSILSRIITGSTSQKITPLILDDTSDDEIPLLLNNYRHERYEDKEQYERLLNYLQRIR